MKHLLFLVFLVAAPAFPQSLDFGIKGGVPLTDAFKHGITAPLNPSTYTSETRRYTLGPTVELRLPLGVGIEFDALYKRLGYDSTFPGIGQAATALLNGQTQANSWEFPLLVKLRSPGILFRPFLDGGVSFRTLTGVKQFVTGLAGDRTPPELRDKNERGLVFGAGFEIGAPFVKFSPEFRYTRWGNESFRDALNIFRSNRNQADFLIGITF